MSEPDISDEDFEISDNEYIDNQSILSGISHSENIETVIDMDEPILIQTVKPLQSIQSNQKTKLTITKKKHPDISSSESSKKPIIIEQVNAKPQKKTTTIEKKEKDKDKDKDKEDHKTLKADSNFEFNQETIDYFSRDILTDFKKICIPNSTFINDTALLCLLLKLNVFKDYKCSTKKCRIGKTWLDKPIQLLIHRKNGKQSDLSPSNLELLCPNCYISKYGLELFLKITKKTLFTCKLCNYPLSSFSNNKKKDRYCLSCESRIMNVGYYDKQSEFINKLKETINEESVMKEDEFTSSKYFNEVSQYKKFDKTDNKSKSNRNIDSTPIIHLNMTVPNLDDLLDNIDS